MDRYLVGLVKELVRQGVEVTLFHRQREPLNEAHVSDLGCEVVGLSDLGGLHWEQVAVPLALRRGRYDLYHAPAERGVPLGAPCPVVLTIHSVTAHSYSDMVQRGLLPGSLSDYLGYDWQPHQWNFASLYARAQFRRASHIFTPSEFSRSEVIKFIGLSPTKVTTTLLAVHEQFKRPVHSVQERAKTLQKLGVRKPYLLYVGGYERHKNVEGLLEAFALVRAANPGLNLVIVGSKFVPEAVHRKIEKLSLQLSGSVVMLVNLTEDLTDLYDEAELFVSLSWRETFGLPALEALTRGLPVVASAWGASPEVVNHAGNLVDPRQPNSASEAILKMLKVSQAPQVRAACQQQAETFSWIRTAATTRNVYQQLCD
ncbi:MAG: glycosyltransferase family 1 protein [Acidobacteriota bacterium]